MRRFDESSRPSPQAVTTDPAGARVRERRGRYWRGHLAEWRAVAMLMTKGYRLVGRRVETPVGEIDLVMRRGRRIAFVEVKHRATRASAEAAMGERQRCRLRRAADQWLAKRPRDQACDLGFDLVLVIGWGWPVHLQDVL